MMLVLVYKNWALKASHAHMLIPDGFIYFGSIIATILASTNFQKVDKFNIE